MFQALEAPAYLFGVPTVGGTGAAGLAGLAGLEERDGGGPGGSEFGSELGVLGTPLAELAGAVLGYSVRCCEAPQSTKNG